MRLFYLQNENGNRIPLNNETGIFLSEPEGLGISFGDSFVDIGEGFFRMVSKKYNQNSIGGKLLFLNDPYKSYMSFIEWCISARDLYFIYRPKDIEYYIHIEIESLQKNEINQYGCLEIPVKFKYLSPWYIPYPAVITMIGGELSPFCFGTDSVSGSRFGDDENPTTDVFSGSSSESYTSDIHPIGHMPPAIKLTISGECNNPVIILTGKKTGTQYGRCAINHSFGLGSVIELSTMYEDSYIRCFDILGTETDLLPYIDLTTDPFFKVPLTEDCVLTISDDGALNGKVNGYVYYYYRSV